MNKLEERYVFGQKSYDENIRKHREEIKVIENKIESLRLKRRELNDKYAQEHAPYKVGDRIIIKWHENVGSIISPIWDNIEYKVEIYKTLVRFRVSRNAMEYEYKVKQVNKDGTVRKGRFKEGELIAEEHIVRKINS